MEKYNHIEDRKTIKWTSFGKLGNKPPRHTFIKDLADSHLMRIVEHITQRPRYYTPEILQLMKDEVTYRTNQFIFIPESYD